MPRDDVKNIIELLRSTREQYPSKIAIKWNQFKHFGLPKERLTSFTFDYLEGITNQISYYFNIKKELIKPPSSINQHELNETIVGIHLPRETPDWIIFVISVWKAGGAIMLLDKTLKAEELASRIKDAGCRLVISDIDLPIEREDLSLVKPYQVFTQEIRSLPSKIKCMPVAEEQLAYITYTSGSTNAPKGIAINHSGIVPLVKEHVKQLELTINDRILQFSHFSFDACLMELFLMMSGACLVLPPSAVQLSYNLPYLLEREKISTIILVPSMIVQLEKTYYLKKIISTGEAITSFQFNRLLILNGKLILLNGYGPSECTVGVALQRYLKNQGIYFSNCISENAWVFLDENGKILLKNFDKSAALAISGKSLARGYIKNGY